MVLVNGMHELSVRVSLRQTTLLMLFRRTRHSHVGDVRGLVIALVDEISYRLRQGETVALEVGRFHLTVESEPVDNPDDFDIKKHIKNVKCRFVPTSTRNARTGKKEQTLANGARVEWAEPDLDDDDDW